MKIDRISIHQKFGGHCSYCGSILELKKMQIDHFVPIYRGWENRILEGFGLERGQETEENLFPSCARCNRWKSTWNIEQFRREIESQIERLNKRSSNYRMAKDFELVRETEKKVIFFFEKYKK
jgi:5-methylcytosine-specific restriction endonuclease McrA